VLDRTDAAPAPDSEQATQLATDILDVAQFLFASARFTSSEWRQENDYMALTGDLTHAVWKSALSAMTSFFRRGRKRVMVSDYAMGTWQITRETLRAAHQLYLKEQHDYTLLPARLRPPRVLNPIP